MDQSKVKGYVKQVLKSVSSACLTPDLEKVGTSTDRHNQLFHWPCLGHDFSPNGGYIKENAR